jgi:nicotinamide riboside transporter PnuC
VIDYTWILSGNTVLMMWLAGRKKYSAWIVGLLNQGFWIYLIYDKKTYGLIVLTVLLWCIYTKNLITWIKDKHDFI